MTETVITPEVILTPLSDNWTPKDQLIWEDRLNNLGAEIRDKGHLIVIPTETVYGLGANALDRRAVLRIFEAKQRPLSDPVICHVSCYQDALPLLKCDTVEMAAIEILAENFWPGPLSLVARASSIIPSEVTAGTGFVSVRCPRNSVALDIIRASQVPIAAPSANRFGHISPSCSSHVTKNFKSIRLDQFSSQTRLPILDGGACQIGIESTVCKIERTQESLYNHEGNKDILEVVVLRRGHVTKEMIQDALRDSKPLSNSMIQLTDDEIQLLRGVEVKISETILYSDVQKQPLLLECSSSNSPTNFSTSTTQSSNTTSPSVEVNEAIYCSPGMLLTHYSPSVPTYLCSEFASSIVDSMLKLALPNSSECVQLNQCVVIDSFGKLENCRNHAAAYLSLSESCDVSVKTAEEIQQNVFQELHNAENLAIKLNSRIILIYNFRIQACRIGEPGLAAYDRIFRAASGQSIKIIK